MYTLGYGELAEKGCKVFMLMEVISHNLTSLDPTI